MSHQVILVGITALLTIYSVQASQLVQPQEINNALQPKTFWWMTEDSPLKRSYDVFKRCASHGDCGGSASFGSGEASAGPIQIDRNVFLSGSPSEPSGGIAAFHSGANVKLNNNPFLSGQYVSAGQQNGECGGSGKACVPKHACVNGVLADVKEDTIRKNVRICNADEVCCSLNGKLFSNANGFTAGKSSFPEKFGGNFEANAGGVQVNFIGQSGSPSSTAKPVRDLSGSGGFQFSSTPDYSNVNFDSNVRFNPDFEGEDYLPPVQTSCPPGTYKTASGNCELVRAQCPPGSRPTPAGGCEVIPTPGPRCGPGQREGPYGQCVDIPRPTSPPRPVCGPQEILSPSGQCIARPTPPPTTARPTCAPGQRPGPYGGCINIQTPAPTTTPRPTCPPGQRPGPYGGCINIQTAPPSTTARPTCPPGQIAGAYGGCINIQTQAPTTTARPTCPPGQRPGPYGGCISIQTQRPSPQPTTPGYEYPRPTCPPGQRLGSLGQCERIPQPTTTPRPTCPPGQRQGPYGGCVAIQTPSPTTPRPTCGSNQYLGPNGQCVYIQTRPPTTARPTCPPGQRPGPYGGCINIQTAPPPTTARPTCPPGQRPGPYGGCISIQTPPSTTPRPTCPPGSFPTTGGGCQRPATTQRPTTGYEYPKPCPPGYIKTPTGQCEPPPPPRPVCPSGTFLGASGNCERPQPPPPPPTTPSYLPPKQETPRPGYQYPVPTPSFEDGRDVDDTDRNPDGSRTNEYVVVPPNQPQPPQSRPSTTRQPSPPRQPPPARQPSSPGYQSGSEIDEAVIPVGCAAAMKCVQEIYCSPQGTISATPVILSKEQELFRVPTTICREIESGTLGVCCRDTNYQDPWPSANLKNGIDDGQYAEDDSIGQYKGNKK